MSFSSDVKTELCAVRPENGCCLAAQAYGMLEFSRAFSLSDITVQSENEAVATLCAELFPLVCRVPSPPIKKSSRAGGGYTVSVAEVGPRRRVIERFGHSGSAVSLRINRANFDCETCASSFLRGVFLACGAVSNPQNDYHLEFSVPYLKLSQDLSALCWELGIRVKSVVRKGNYVLYLKGSEQIEDCLALMGASNAALEMMNVQMIKDIRNKVNRIANCETANIDKTVAAASAHIQAIRKIEQTIGLDKMPVDLQEVARIRVNNPEFSLRELGQALEPPLTRSGVNHRLARIVEFAEDLEKRKKLKEEK